MNKWTKVTPSDITTLPLDDITVLLYNANNISEFGSDYTVSFGFVYETAFFGKKILWKNRYTGKNQIGEVEEFSHWMMVGVPC